MAARATSAQGLSEPDSILRALRGHPLGYFHHGLGNLQAVLEHHPTYPKLVQVHARLIAKALEASPELAGPAGAPAEVQRATFVSIVQRYRPDLDADLIGRCLEGRPSPGP